MSEQGQLIRTEEFRAREGSRVALKKRPPLVKPFYDSRKEYLALIEEQVGALNSLQNLHYASGRHAVLFIFQAMDAAGKDSTIRHVMSGVNPQGCQVFSFKQPSLEELRHDFLWRTTLCLPERGRIGIFNRSYYEEVLIVRVHPELLRAQGISEKKASRNSFWKGRYRSIVQFENHLHRSGTQIVKFYLHLSKEEQRKRFLQRIDDPEKNWKFSEADIKERKYWKDYITAYEDCIAETSTNDAPWYIIPADDRENARLIVSQVAVETLRSLKPAYPATQPERKKELESFRRLLQKEKKTNA
jgi:PPK2 family polyphosphate:nucleotide phosphotransferase